MAHNTDFEILSNMTTDDINAAILMSGQIDRDAISCGPHTFGDLFNERALLFSVLCSLFPKRAWKSHAHSDGEVWPGFFIAGIETPEGQYTYHYKTELWDTFDVPEIPHAPEYDGHSSADVVRLFSLADQPNKELWQQTYDRVKNRCTLEENTGCLLIPVPDVSAVRFLHLKHGLPYFMARRIDDRTFAVETREFFTWIDRPNPLIEVYKEKWKQLYAEQYPNGFPSEPLAPLSLHEQSDPDLYRMYLPESVKTTESTNTTDKQTVYTTFFTDWINS